MKYSPFSLLLASFLVLSSMSSCDLFRKVGKKPTADEASYALAEEVMNNAFEFKEAAITGKANIKSPDVNLSASYRIHLEKDKQILIRISKFVEILKILITQDSIFVQDKFNQNYYACDYSLAKEYLGVEANFEMIQALLLGDYYPIPEDMKLTSPAESNPLKFSGTLDSTMIDYYLDKELKKLVRLGVTNPQLEGQSNAYYEGFEKVNNQDFPMEFRLEVPAPLDGEVRFNHKRVQVNPTNLNFEFNIPSGYTRQDCP